MIWFSSHMCLNFIYPCQKPTAFQNEEYWYAPKMAQNIVLWRLFRQKLLKQPCLVVSHYDLIRYANAQLYKPGKQFPKSNTKIKHFRFRVTTKLQVFDWSEQPHQIFKPMPIYVKNSIHLILKLQIVTCLSTSFRMLTHIRKLKKLQSLSRLRISGQFFKI